MSVKTDVVIAVFSILVLPALANAQNAGQALRYGMTEMEILMLPDYCRARVGTDPQARDQWSKRIGNDKFIHLHHYCSGLNSFNRAKVTLDRRVKAAKLEFAVKEFDYVLRAWPADFALAKEAQSMKDQAAVMR